MDDFHLNDVWPSQPLAYPPLRTIMKTYAHFNVPKQHRMLRKMSVQYKNKKNQPVPDLFITTRPMHVWKKVNIYDKISDIFGNSALQFKAYAIAQLWVPEGTIIHSGEWQDKKRIEWAIVESISNYNKSKYYEIARSTNYDFRFIYKVGELVTSRKPFSYRPNTCASGIHCFLDRKSAVYY